MTEQLEGLENAKSNHFVRCNLCRLT